MIPERDIYLDLALQAAPRLFGLLDRAPFSPAYGSWHRGFWHERRSDFSSSACQQGMLAAALLHRGQGTPYSGKETVREWTLAAMRWLIGLQHGDGSFDEWYPNERGWAGPTGYVVYALAATHELLGVGGELSARARACAERACRFLAEYEELDVLANHQAMALLALAASRAWLGVDVGGDYEKIFARLRGSYTNEGWSLEYDGADPGYQTASLSFLARVHQLTGDGRIEELAKKELEFLQWFFLGERSFGGVVGSRSTRNLFHFGFEYWASRLPLAETLAAEGRHMLAARTALAPGDQDDHYLLYRLPELLEAFRAAPPRVEKRTELPCERAGDFQQHFAEAGIVCVKRNGDYLVTNLKKGGALRLLTKDGHVSDDAGCVVELAGGKMVTTSSLTGQAEVTVGATLESRGPAASLELPLFTPLTMAAFRGVMAVAGRTPGGAKWLKGQIRRRIMTRPRSRPEVTFARRIRHDGQRFIVEDELQSRAPVTRAWRGGAFLSRLVPQSRYFHVDELDSPCRPLAAEELAELQRAGRVSVVRGLP